MTEAQEKRRERNRRYYEKQKAKKAQSRPVIGDVALARSRAKRNRDVPNIFAPAVPPKSVAPAMALDSAFNDTLGWALGGLTQQTGVTGFLGYPVLAELAQRPEYRRISEILAMEMTRKWVSIKSEGDEDKSEKIKAITKSMERLHIRDVFREAVEQDGFFGRGHIFLDLGVTDDREELQQPIGDGWGLLSQQKVGKGALRRVRSVEAVWCYPSDYNASDPLRTDWFKPNAWFVQGKEVHSTRLLTIIGREVPDLLKPAYSFGGLSLSQMAKPYVDNWLRTRQSVADLISSFSVFVLKTNLVENLATDPNGDQLFKRADFFNNLRDNRGLMITDKELEDFANVSASLSTLDALQAQTQEHMASVSGIPLVKLLGIQPAGLNASSEGELECFYTWINALQESMLTEPLRTILGFIQLSLFGEVDPSITFSWEPLGQVSEAEAAQIRKTNAETGQILISGKVISPEEERQRIASDGDSIYDSIDVETAPAERLTPIEKATIAAGITGAIVQAEGSGLVDTPIAMEELRKLSLATGVWTSITEMDVVEAKLAPEPPEPELPPPGGGGEPGSPFDGAQDGDFSEEDHPRDDDGRFSGGAGSEPDDHADDQEDEDADDEPQASPLSPREQASSVSKAIGGEPDAYGAIERAIGPEALNAIIEDHGIELEKAARAEVKSTPPEERMARGIGAAMNDMSLLSERDADKMERFFAQPFTAETMSDVLGEPIAAIAGRHKEELEALAQSFKDRVADDGSWAGKESPWDEDAFRDEWEEKHDDEPSDEEVAKAKADVENKWFRSAFGDDLSLGVKEAFANWREDPTPVMTYMTPEGERQEGDYAAPGFVRDMQAAMSNLGAGDIESRVGAPLSNVLSGMRSLKVADAERARDDIDNGNIEATFARYAAFAKRDPEAAAKAAPKLTERLAAHLHRSRDTNNGIGMDADWEEDEHPRDDDGRFSAGASSQGTFAGLKPADVYFKLLDAEDAGGAAKVKEVAQQIARERPELADVVVRQAADLGYSNVGVSLYAPTTGQSENGNGKKEDQEDNQDVDAEWVPSSDWAEGTPSTKEASAAFENGVVPEGWAIHGRGRSDDISTGYVTQMSYSTDVARQYSGKNGSVWYLKPNDDAKIMDFSSAQSDDMNSLKEKFLESFEEGDFPDQDWLPEDAEEAWAKVADNFSPPNIVDSAAAYDNEKWVEWLINNTGAAGVVTPDGAVAMDLDQYRKVRAA